MKESKKLDWRPFVSEFVGTGLLLLIGLSLVIFMYGTGSPVSAWIPNHKFRQILSGFLFGCVGGGIALSSVGKISGAHINPVVTLGFRLLRKIDMKTTIGYIVAQLSGAVVGCLPLWLWGKLGKSIDFGATTIGQDYSVMEGFLGEMITTFILVTSLCLFIAYRKLRNFTPFMIPFLYAIMVPLETDISGTSTNPARSFGPAVISGQWTNGWIYWVAPIVGTVIAMLVCSYFAKRIETAKLYHFESDNRLFFANKQKQKEANQT